MAARQPKSIVGAQQVQGRRQLPPSGGIRTAGPIAFQVHGLPIPQGSTRSWLVNGKPVITSTAKGLSSWRRLVADGAQRFAPAAPCAWPGGIDLHLGLSQAKIPPYKTP